MFTYGQEVKVSRRQDLCFGNEAEHNQPGWPTSRAERRNLRGHFSTEILIKFERSMKMRHGEKPGAPTSVSFSQLTGDVLG